MGFIHLYTGDGEGKTLTAFGLALRAVGHGYKVIIVQFMKGRRDVGEYKVKDRLAPNYVIRQFGREEFIDLGNPSPVDYILAGRAINFARRALSLKPRLLILDEINLAASIGLVPLDDVLELLSDIPESTTVVLTGRNAPKDLVEIADLVTEMHEIKHPWRKGVQARRGIEY